MQAGTVTCWSAAMLGRNVGRMWGQLSRRTGDCGSITGSLWAEHGRRRGGDGGGSSWWEDSDVNAMRCVLSGAGNG